MKEIETISGNQVFIVDGKCDFSKPSIFEQLAKINKLKYFKNFIELIKVVIKTQVEQVLECLF